MLYKRTTVTLIMALSTLPLISFTSLSNASASTNYVWDGGAQSSDSSALPNYGVRSVIDVMNQPSMPSGTALLSWVSDELSNGIWIQAGYQNTPGSAPNGFLQVWNLNTFSMLMNKNFPVATGPHTFSIYLKSGTTWAVAYDTTEITTYNAGSSVSSSSYPVESIVEMQAPTVFSFNTIDFPTVMQVQKSSGGSWSNVNTATAYGNQYGTQGQLQNPSLSSNYILVSSSITVTPAATPLWKIVSTSDTSPPTISITSPATNTWQRSVVTVSASATDNVGVSNVQFYVDGALKVIDATSPYSFNLDTTTLSTGSHVIKAIATDTSKNQAAATITLNVDNVAPSFIIPASITAQATSGSGAMISYSVTANDNVAVTSLICSPGSGSIFALGTTAVSCTAKDVAGNTAIGTFAVSVIDSTAPSLSISAPAKVSGTVTVSVSATDNTGIASVAIYIDGKLRITDSSAPYSYSWNTKFAKQGSHTILAVAADLYGNQASASLVVIK